MKKQTLALTEKQARKLWKNNPEVRELLEETFPNTDLSKKPFPKSWEDLEKINGHYINNNSCQFHTSNNFTASRKNKNVFPTKEDAQKSLAEAQLRQLAYRINDEESEEEWCDWHGKSANKKFIVEYSHFKDKLSTTSTYGFHGGGIYFKTHVGAQKSIKHHKELWKRYFKIK